MYPSRARFPILYSSSSVVCVPVWVMWAAAPVFDAASRRPAARPSIAGCWSRRKAYASRHLHRQGSSELFCQAFKLVRIVPRWFSSANRPLRRWQPLAGASLKCGREPKVPPHNAPLLKCGARGEVDGMAGVTAFFHRGLCPLCGGGFRRCRFETLLFTPTEERRLPAGERLRKKAPR